MKSTHRILLPLLLILIAALNANAQEKKALQTTDIMKFRQLVSPSISKDGNWVVHTSKPDRGDPEVMVYSTDGKRKYSIPQGEKPELSGNGKWVAAVKTVPAEELLQSKPAKEEPGSGVGLSLLNTSTGEQSVFENVQAFEFSKDSKWLIYQNSKKEEESGDKKSEKSDEKKDIGTLLNVMSLEDERILEFPYVSNYAIDSISHFLAFATADTTGEGNGVFLVDLTKNTGELLPVYTDSAAWASYFSWNNRTGNLAFLGGILDKKGKPLDARLFLWTPAEDEAKPVLSDEDLPKGWKIYHKNSLRWTKDGKRLFMGIKPASEILTPDEEKKDSISKLFDIEAILADRGVDVWHWNDPQINPNQKKMWERKRDKTYTGVFYPETGTFIPLADEEMPDLSISESSSTLLGSSNVPYAKQMTWEDRIEDYYLIDLASGKRKLALREQRHRVNLSPDGEFLVYFLSGDWHMMITSSLESRNLTGDLDVPFADEDWDYPGEVPGYGVGDWIDESEAVMIYDKYDIWQFPSKGGNPVCLTQGKGREGKYQFRIKSLATDKEYLETGETVFLTAYHDTKKFTAIYSIKVGTPGVTKIVEEPKRFTLLAKAKDADKILFTRESYTEFPDLWVTDQSFKKPGKLTDLNPQIKEFAWGEAELVEWSSMDGTPLQGILIKPGNYTPGEKYPVLVYYYRFFTDRLYEFNEVVINHRPCFPFYASNGYAVFLPDIRFDIGNPGYSATKCLVPGVQKIIDMGVADPDAVCLHGHSWSGYQTAFVITQTDIFACAIAGAPVANMTSAYSGIRWGTGLARQFQYEKSQSRIGANLWEARDKYIENSPVFFADRINTPLLIEFGDEDEAVPWYQGIELYLAMRRLEKDCVFLQYRGEPHHLKQYANKLDYTLKFKEYLDHYLKGEPAPEWIKSGIPYQGK